MLLDGESETCQDAVTLALAVTMGGAIAIAVSGVKYEWMTDTLMAVMALMTMWSYALDEHVAGIAASRMRLNQIWRRLTQASMDE